MLQQYTFINLFFLIDVHLFCFGWSNRANSKMHKILTIFPFFFFFFFCVFNQTSKVNHNKISATKCKLVALNEDISELAEYRLSGLTTQLHMLLATNALMQRFMSNLSALGMGHHRKGNQEKRVNPNLHPTPSPLSTHMLRKLQQSSFLAKKKMGVVFLPSITNY